MNKHISSNVSIALLLASLATLMALSTACAESPGDSFTPSLVPSTLAEDASVLNRRLLAAQKDLEQFLVFAEHFKSTGDTKTAEQLQAPLDSFLKRHVDHLLIKGTEQASLETTQLSAEIMLLKTRLFLSLNQVEAAKITVSEMKKRFGPYQKNMVQVAGKSTMLSEALRQLDEDLAMPARSKKK